jgi:Cu-Zn family superoxide dismutase
MLKKARFPSIFSNSLASQLLASSLLLMTVTSCACTDDRTADAEKKERYNREIAAVLDTFAAKRAPVVEAVAQVKSFKGDEIKGKVVFTRVPNGIRIVADIDGLTPGKHGFHIHESGDCSSPSTVGSHFNPTNSKHGGPDSAERHVGDLGNLVADERGHAHYERVDTVISFEGEKSILDRSIVIHSDADDFTTQPTGNSGDKIACGVIKAVSGKEVPR